MISCIHEYPDGASDPDKPEPLAIVADAGPGSKLEDIAHFLIAESEPRYDLGGIVTHLGARPLRFDIRGLGRIGEDTFWSRLIDTTNEDSVDWIDRYVSASIARLSDDEDLPFCTSREVVGQHPIYSYFDAHLRQNRSATTDKAALTEVVRVFIRYLRRCDLDHEVLHAEYVLQALSFLKRHDRECYIELLLLFMVCQQEGPAALPLIFLKDDGVMRVAADHLIEQDSGQTLYLGVLELCATVHGSNDELTAEVLEYCRQRSDLGEERDPVSFSRGLTHARRRRDIDAQSYPTSIDTGFHRFDKKTRRWQIIDSRKA